MKQATDCSLCISNKVLHTFLATYKATSAKKYKDAFKQVLNITQKYVPVFVFHFSFFFLLITDMYGHV